MCAFGAALSCPLILAPPRQRMTLDRLTGGAETKARLSALGLIPGAEIEVICRQAAGAILVAVKESRLVLGPALAQHLWVR